MSFPNIPDVLPDIDIDPEDAINLLLASIAFEELGLAHLINAEAEKIQFVLGTLENQPPPVTPPTIEDLLEINRSVENTIKSVIKTQMLLQFKLEEVLSISTTTTTTTTTSTTTTATTTTQYEDAGSAWSVGTHFGQGNAEYTTLAINENEKTVVLGLGNNHIPIGTVEITRTGNTLSVTISTDPPYVMDQVHLYVDNVAPTNSAPGQFPYIFEVTDPADYFDSHTFNVDISAFAGQIIYIAAHARVLQPV